MTAQMPDDGVRGKELTVAAIYSRLSSIRDNFLEAARDNAIYTIPSLMPPEGTASGQKLYKPYQSVGSHCVNTLTSKLVETLLPASNPVFHFQVSDEVVKDLADDNKARSDVEKKFNEIERTVVDEIEGLGIRAALTEAVKQLIVSGNVLLYLPPKGNLKYYRLDRYVTQRDFEGNHLRSIVKETVALETLPEDVLEILNKNKIELPSDDNQPDGPDQREVDVYTVFERKADRLYTYQCIQNIKLPRSRGSWPLDRAPVMSLRWNYLHNEDYGRAYVDEYIGDITAAERMSKNIREGVAAMTKINPMVNPTGLTRADDVAKAENLEIIAGREDDVTMLQMNKQADLQFAGEFLNTIISRLQTAFMMNRSAQRDAERVTAEEFRAVVKDIDDTLGGVYSLLANELQKPLVSIVIHRMERQKKIPKLSSLKGADGKPIATPKVITGIEALGRGHDYNKYRTFMTEIVAPLKEAAIAEISIPDLLKRAAVSLSIDTDGLLKDEDTKQQEQAAALKEQQNMLQGQMAGDAVKGAVPAIAREGAPALVEQIQAASEAGGLPNIEEE